MTTAKIMEIISSLLGCDGQAADAVSAYTQVKWKMLKNYWKFHNRSVQTFGFVNHDTNGLNHGPVWKTQSFLLEGICTVILWQDYNGRGNLRRSYLKHGWEKIPNCECLFVHRETGLFLSVYVDDIKFGWKETQSWSDVETTQQRSRFGRTNTLPGSCVLGLHSKTMPNKQRYCGQLQNHAWISNFREGSREITILSKSSYFFMVLWHGWSCKEMCRTILWVGKLDDLTFYGQ